MELRRFFIFAVAVVLSVSACSKTEEPPASQGKESAGEVSGDLKQAKGLPSGHPVMGTTPAAMDKESAQDSHMTMRSSKEVRVADDIRSKWSEVELRVGDNEANSSDVLKLKLGERKKLKDTGYYLVVEVFVPDYAIFDDHVGTRSADPNNPAVLLELFEGDKSVARGWVFRNEAFSGFNSYRSERFPVLLITPGSGS